MHANEGDWLIVNGRTLGTNARHGRIVETRKDGTAPFLVRWTDNDHETLFMPGPDAVVVPASEMAARDAAERDRLTQLQDSIVRARRRDR